jgi:hypothetical protein
MNATAVEELIVFWGQFFGKFRVEAGALIGVIMYNARLSFGVVFPR